MTRFTLAATALLVVAGFVAVAVARRLGHSGSRASVLTSVATGWLAAWILWGFAGSLAARYGWLAAYDGTLFGLLALAGGVWQYRAHLAGGRQRGLTVFVAGQLVWLGVVFYLNGGW